MRSEGSYGVEMGSAGWELGVRGWGRSCGCFGEVDRGRRNVNVKGAGEVVALDVVEYQV